MSSFVHKSPPFRQISDSEYKDGRASTKEMASAMVVRKTNMVTGGYTEWKFQFLFKHETPHHTTPPSQNDEE
jgi:hypothetical protein